MTKRYHWLKLKEDFFSDDTIQWLEEQPNGKEYVLFYLKLCLKSISNEGLLVRYVGEKLIAYDTVALAKLTGTKEDTVKVAMNLFIDIGLVQVFETGEIYMQQINEMIGSETDSARRVRKHRINEQNKQLKLDMLQSNKNVTTEIEIELEKDKEIEIIRSRFDRFWKAYPRKVSKGQAEKTFKKKVKNEDTLNLILNDLSKRKYYAQWQKDKGQYIPHASTYLNAEQWLDEYDISITGSTNQDEWLSIIDKYEREERE